LEKAFSLRRLSGEPPRQFTRNPKFWRVLEQMVEETPGCIGAPQPAGMFGGSRGRGGVSSEGWHVQQEPVLPG
jgi:hypothetical protein